MHTRGRHLLVEYHGCDAEVLDDLRLIERTMRRAADAAGATVVASIFHPFRPQGVTGVVVVEESHLSIHTWPEKGYAAVDFYTCGACNPRRAHEVLVEALKPVRSEHLVVQRGLPEDSSLKVDRRVEEIHDACAADVSEAEADVPLIKPACAAG